jgi:hypothetical protein
MMLFFLGENKRPESVSKKSLTLEYNNILYIIIIYNIIY